MSGSTDQAPRSKSYGYSRGCAVAAAIDASPGNFSPPREKKKKMLVGPIGSIYPHNKNKQHENRKTVNNIPNDSGRATGDDIDRRKQNSEHLNIEKKG